MKIKLSNEEAAELVDAVLDSGYLQFEIDGYGWQGYSVTAYMEEEDIEKIKPDLEKILEKVLNKSEMD